MLGALVATAQQEKQQRATPREVHPVPGAIIDTHLRNAAADRPHVTGIADGQAIQSCPDASHGTLIAQCGEPVPERLGLEQLGHVSTIGYRY